jgi:hypothetical protein
MARYVFCPWPPPERAQKGGKNVVDIISKRTDEWSRERELKGKEGYTFVFWMENQGNWVQGGEPQEGKITLKDGDQVYIKGHHQAGLGFISDITKQEDDEIANLSKIAKKAFVEKYGLLRPGGNKAEQQRLLEHRLLERVRTLRPEDLARRFFDCFQAPKTWVGKVKFYNCSSGANGGASFAKPAADRLRALWPNATYIGYAEALQQEYGDYNPDDQKEQLRKMLEELPPNIERRKLGAETHTPARDLQIRL